MLLPGGMGLIPEKLPFVLFRKSELKVVLILTALFVCFIYCEKFYGEVLHMFLIYEIRAVILHI